MAINHFKFSYVGPGIETELDETVKMIKKPSMMIAGVVLNKSCFDLFKKIKTVKSHRSDYYGFPFMNIWDGIAIFIKRYQRGNRVFYDIAKLGEYLNES